MDAIVLLKEGDWVSGTTAQDEKFIGFVESVGAGGTVHVYVTQSDREAAVGTTVETKTAKAKKLPDYVPSAKSQLRDLIELALATHDKEWFESLSAMLVSAGPDRSVPDTERRPGRMITPRF
ncbi:IDEAL domain-containing protein [Paenibacillus sp. GYB003]|uniref:IDEAL domain-containing protein n=1 Tax=Paenibacillus sp. GYB003 TaxID=2994392 RepID=UPI002F964AE6